jgi:hypothetical protein
MIQKASEIKRTRRPLFNRQVEREYRERVVRGRIDGEQDQEGEGTDGALFILVRPARATLAPPGFPPAPAGEPWVPFLPQYRVPSFRSSSGLA